VTEKETIKLLADTLNLAKGHILTAPRRTYRNDENELEQLILLRIDEVLAEAAPGPAPVIELNDAPGVPEPILEIQA
jgi:hypothetical protein